MNRSRNQMKIDDSWLTLSEAASKLDRSLDQIFRLGIAGKLKLSFDWVVYKVEADALTPKLQSIFRFEEADSYYCPDRKCDIDASFPTSEPDYTSDTLLRLATLSVHHVALITKYGEALITEAMLSTHERLVIRLPDEIEVMEYPKVSKKDIVVKLSDIIEYENLISTIALEKKPKAESPKEIDNLYKLIGLLSMAVADINPQKFKPTGELKAKTIAEYITRYIPEDMGDSGIGIESNRKKISVGKRKFDPNNY